MSIIPLTTQSDSHSCTYSLTNTLGSRIQLAYTHAPSCRDCPLTHTLTPTPTPTPTTTPVQVVYVASLQRVLDDIIDLIKGEYEVRSGCQCDSLVTTTTEVQCASSQIERGGVTVREQRNLEVVRYFTLPFPVNINHCFITTLTSLCCHSHSHRVVQS
jgi:hypothetical protein